MLRFCFVLLLSLVGLACASTTDGGVSAQAHSLAQELIVLDGHIDVPIRLWSQSKSGAMANVSQAAPEMDFDYPRARQGGLDAPFFSIFTPASAEAEGGAKAMADGLIDIVEGIVSRASDKFVIARTAAEVRAAKEAGKIALLLGMENGGPIEGSLANLEHFWARGVRYITLCHGADNHICDSSYDTRRTNGGLSSFGRELVQRMNDLGVLVDVSHIDDASFWQVMDLTRVPAIASHSSARHFVPGFERNMSDEMIRRLAQNGGVLQINFGSTFLTREANQYNQERKAAIEAFRAANQSTPDSAAEKAFVVEWVKAHPFPRAHVRDVADHIDHVVRLVGVEHVGLGSDFDGVGDTLPDGLRDVSQYPNLLAELLRRGYSKADLALICGENVLRVLEIARLNARALP